MSVLERKFVKNDGIEYVVTLSMDENEIGGFECSMKIGERGIVYVVDKVEYSKFVDGMERCSDVEFCLVVEDELRWISGLGNDVVCETGKLVRKRVLH